MSKKDSEILSGSCYCLQISELSKKPLEKYHLTAIFVQAAVADSIKVSALFADGNHRLPLTSTSRRSSARWVPLKLKTENINTWRVWQCFLPPYNAKVLTKLSSVRRTYHHWVESSEVLYFAVIFSVCQSFPSLRNCRHLADGPCCGLLLPNMFATFLSTYRPYPHPHPNQPTTTTTNVIDPDCLQSSLCTWKKAKKYMKIAICIYVKRIFSCPAFHHAFADCRTTDLPQQSNYSCMCHLLHYPQWKNW